MLLYYTLISVFSPISKHQLKYFPVFYCRAGALQNTLNVCCDERLSYQPPELKTRDQKSYFELFNNTFSVSLISDGFTSYPIKNSPGGFSLLEFIFSTKLGNRTRPDIRTSCTLYNFGTTCRVNMGRLNHSLSNDSCWLFESNTIHVAAVFTRLLWVLRVLWPWGCKV